ncbi:hypothetical protein D3C71_1562300 [compost metagenome]
MIEQRLLSIESQGDVGSVFSRGVLVLEARCKRLLDEHFLPSVGQRGVVSIPAPQHHAPELGHHQQGVLHDLGTDVVAIDQNGHFGVVRD